MAELPSGTVTFLFTDLEGSTRLWQDHPEAMRSALARHDAIVRGAIEDRGGYVVKTTGDGFHAAFAAAHDAIDAAVAVQLTLAAEKWGETGPLRVRAGIHSGPAELREGDYDGTSVNRAARLMSVAHGGQVVVSVATSELVRDGSVELVSLGEHRLKGLTDVERVFQVAAPGLASEFPPLQSLDALPGNLPRQVTTFVGREDEVALLAELVRGSPVVTLTGVGGVGKTRLSLEVAADVVPAFADGAWFCEFAPVADPGAVWEALAATLRVQSFPGRSLEESVLEYLTEKRLLLVLDNCEHLLAAIARLVDAIVRRCEHVSVLATSREGLGVAGERMVAVPSLGVPAEEADIDELLHADAVRLFGDRAGAAKADFLLTDRNAGAVGVLCRRLDGIPLAIELAAARVRSMSPDDLVARLDQRFKLLTKGSRAALERQQTLRATIDWSYDLLDPTERLVLDRLSVFAGGCDLAAAEVVAAGDDLDAFEVDDVLSQLVDKSLVVADDTNRGVRYRLLETIRQYAQERLEASGDLAPVRSAHADYYVGLAESAGPRLRSRELPAWARRIERETDNFRIVVDWAVDTAQPELALRLVAQLRGHGHATGYSAMEWADTAIEIPGAEELPQFLAVASWATFGATMRQDFARATEVAARIETIQAHQGRAEPMAYWGLGTLAFFQGDLAGAHRLAEEWTGAARAADDGYELSHALVLRAATELSLAEPMGRAHLEDAVRVARDTGTLSALSIALGMIVNQLDVDADDADRALALTDEALAVASALDDPVAMAVSTATRAMLLAARGDRREALALAKQAAEAMRLSNSLAASGGAFCAAALALAEDGDHRVAAIFLGAAHVAGPMAGWGERRMRQVEATLRTELGAEFQTLYEQGAALTPTEATAYLVEMDRAESA